jgi:hypothetical protein
MNARWSVPALAAALLLASSGALAQEGGYCRAKACDTEPAYDDIWQEMPDASCDRDTFGCQSEGVPLYWPQACISFTVQQDGSPLRGIDYDSIHGVVTQAFNTWLSADCGGYPPSFAISDYGAVSCDEPEYNQTRPNANVVMFRDDGWDKNYDAFNTLALTTLSYNTENAQIYDADIEIDSAEWNFVVSESTDIGEDEVDLQAVVTHEVGHFLGLSHSNNEAATMWASYYGGETQQRTLHAVDMAGICEIFPPGQAVNTHACTPRHGFASECQPDDDFTEGGCAVRAPSGRSGTTAVLAGSLALFAFARRRRRARGAARHG